MAKFLIYQEDSQEKAVKIQEVLLWLHLVPLLSFVKPTLDTIWVFYNITKTHIPKFFH